MNKSDSERIAAVLENNGYKIASSEKEAHLVVVNMCSVRQSAVDRIYGLNQKLFKLKTSNTILTGCILKKDKRKFADKFDLILDIKDLLKWPQYLKKIKAEKSKKEKNETENYLSFLPKYENNFSALVPISNGCNNFCAYCVVPFTRGLLVCRNHEEILEEVKNVVKKGFKEIWLLGQNVNDYRSPTNNSITESRRDEGEDEGKLRRRQTSSINFSKLLEMTNEIPGDFWIRFTSPHPKDFSDQLIETMAKCQKITPYLNLPLQSGDDDILKKMNRPYTIKEYKNLVKKIRAAFKKYRKGLEKKISLSTDIIVGFPGETEKQFKNTILAFKKTKFDMAYIAKYSPRPQTKAFKLKDDIGPKEKNKRYQLLTKILKKTALENNRYFQNKKVKVLIEKQGQSFLLGKTRHFKTLKCKFPSFKKEFKGSFIEAKVINVSPFGLKGIFNKKL